MSKDYRELEGIINNASDQFKVAYDKGYKQGVADAKEDMKNIIEDAERRGYIKAKAETTLTLDKTKTNDHEKSFEGCDGCIFEMFEATSNPCRFCKHNDPSYTESHFIPKPCDHEWVESYSFIDNSPSGCLPCNNKILYCKKCGLLRIEL